MADADQRAVLSRLIDERGEDYAGLSRLIGRNAAYIQQFIKRGTPRRLAERDRRILAGYFGVSEELLGGPEPVRSGSGRSLVALRRLDVRASAGPGSLVEKDNLTAEVAFDAAWLRRFSEARPEELSLISVTGDSMAPTLMNGDEIMVDSGKGSARLRDGIYVLRRDDELLVKRLAVHPATGRVTVRSDNEAYPTWPDCDPQSLVVVGRVVWASRRVS